MKNPAAVALGKKRGASGATICNVVQIIIGDFPGDYSQVQALGCAGDWLREHEAAWSN